MKEVAVTGQTNDDEKASFTEATVGRSREVGCAHAHKRDVASSLANGWAAKHVQLC